MLRRLADQGVGDPDDLQRHGGGDRRLRPHRRHARGRDQRHARARASSPSTACSSSRWASRPSRRGGSALMQKKDLGLLVLILVVGTIVALINPRFVSPINIANTANLVGLFGIFAIGQGFVIITGGIELSVGSVIALLGVLFVDLIANYGVPWPACIVLMLRARRGDRARPRAADHPARNAALHRHAVRAADLSRHRPLVHRRRHGGLRLRPELPVARLADDRAELGHPALADRDAGRRGDHVRRPAPLGLRALPLRRRQERGGGALCRRADRQGHRRGLRHLRGADGDRGDLLRDVHASRSRPRRTATSTSSTPSPPPCSAASACAAARGRSSGWCSGRCCCRCCRTSSTSSASRAR